MLAGIKLEEMEASDMLDVLHYLLDEDTTNMDGDTARAKSSIRVSLYKSIYNKEYTYGIKAATDFSDDSVGGYGGGSSRELKPYIPPTNFNPDAANPFQGSLRETPLG